jgi:hypothetical protein
MDKADFPMMLEFNLNSAVWLVVPPGVDVMITIFCQFFRFSAKNCRFAQKPML